MAAFVKSIAPMQLLGVGDEGFATSLNNQDSASLVASNPGLRREHAHDATAPVPTHSCDPYPDRNPADP